MDSNEITANIANVMQAFGMSPKKAAIIIGVSYDSFRQRMRATKGYTFTAEHLETLKHYIKTTAAEL